MNVDFQFTIEALSSIDVKKQVLNLTSYYFQLYARVIPSYNDVALLGNYHNRDNDAYLVYLLLMS